MADKKLYKSRDKKMFAGVCAGIGKRFGIDPTIIRITWVLLSIFCSFVIGGLIAYIVCALIIPQDPGYIDI
ncbi:MAG: PspC domain-containing protein [Bacillota bacterium]|jgi:phage shock protein C